MDGLRVILTREFKYPETLNNLDVVNALFTYHEETLDSKQISGYFTPIAKGKNTCMWLTKKNGKYLCKLFWNDTAKILVGFSEQVAGKGRGCSFGGTKQVAIIPMVCRQGVRGLAMAK